jgi:hypothetical protein
MISKSDHPSVQDKGTVVPYNFASADDSTEESAAAQGERAREHHKPEQKVASSVNRPISAPRYFSNFSQTGREHGANFALVEETADIYLHAKIPSPLKFQWDLHLREFSLQALGDADHSFHDMIAGKLHQISWVQAQTQQFELLDARLKGLAKQQIQRSFVREKNASNGNLHCVNFHVVNL